VFGHDDEVLTASYYSVDMEAREGGRIFAEQSASMYPVYVYYLRRSMN
jgi:hypothetical protein